MQTAQAIDRSTEHGVITIANIFPAKPGKKTATIKDSDGMLFSVWPNMVSQFRAGESYEIEFTSKDVNGVTYRDIKSGRVTTPPSPPPAQFTAQSAPAPRSLSSAAAQGGKETGGNPGGSGNYYRPTSPRDAERMFVCSTLNAFIQTGRIDCHHKMLADCIGELRQAWAMTFGADPS